MTSVTMFTTKLVKDKTVSLPSEFTKHCDDAGRIAQHLLGEYDREHLLAIFINNANKIIGLNTIGIGHSHGVSTTPKEIFRAAVICGAPAMILAHNHPSGDLHPSKDDISLTNRMLKISKEIGILIMDHIIVGRDDYRSMAPEIGRFF